MIGIRGKGKISLMEKAIEENDGNSDIDLKEMGRQYQSAYILQTLLLSKLQNFTGEIGVV